MAIPEATPCALCLAVDESTSMLQVQLPPQKGVPGMQRHLCAGCVSAIDAAMSESETFASVSQRKADGLAVDQGSLPDAPAALELSDKPPSRKRTKNGDQEAKVAEAHD